MLVDDNSPDNCPSICDEWADTDSRIKVIHKKNAGAGLARNTGLDNATGDYVTFVDSDDYIDIKTVEECIAALQRDKSDMVMFGKFDVYPNGNMVKKSVSADKYLYKNQEVTDKVFAGFFTHEMNIGVAVWGKMISLNIVKNSGVKFRSEREVLSEDAFFLTELFAYISSVSILPENYYYYNQNENSFSRTYKNDYQERNDKFLTGCLEICQRLAYSKEVLLHIKARYQIYSLFGMQQIIASELSFDEKHKALKAVFKNELLKGTITKETLALAKRRSKIFWVLLKLRCYSLCFLILKIKIRK